MDNKDDAESYHLVCVRIIIGMFVEGEIRDGDVCRGRDRDGNHFKKF